MNTGTKILLLFAQLTISLMLLSNNTKKEELKIRKIIL